MMLTVVVVVVNLISQCCVFAVDSGECCDRFDKELNVLQDIVALKVKAAEQTCEINKLKKELEVAEGTIQELRTSLVIKELSADGASYVRWGRTTCPDGAIIVYKGLAAGGHYTHSGTGANRLCLPAEPVWGDNMDGKQITNRLYGAEYLTSAIPFFSYLHNHDVPCAVCRIPRSDVIMIPGRNICYGNYTLEYSGYLMSGYYTHVAQSEFLCIDGEPETAPSGSAGVNGAVFNFVAATCDPLPCPPYVAGRGLTCAVCSYNANIN